MRRTVRDQLAIAVAVAVRYIVELGLVVLKLSSITCRCSGCSTCITDFPGFGIFILRAATTCYMCVPALSLFSFLARRHGPDFAISITLDVAQLRLHHHGAMQCEENMGNGGLPA